VLTIAKRSNGVVHAKREKRLSYERMPSKGVREEISGERLEKICESLIVDHFVVVKRVALLDGRQLDGGDGATASSALVLRLDGDDLNLNRRAIYRRFRPRIRLRFWWRQRVVQRQKGSVVVFRDGAACVGIFGDEDRLLGLFLQRRRGLGLRWRCPLNWW